MKTGDIVQWALVDENGEFVMRVTRQEAEELLSKLDPTGSLGFRIAKLEVVK